MVALPATPCASVFPRVMFLLWRASKSLEESGQHQWLLDRTGYSNARRHDAGKLARSVEVRCARSRAAKNESQVDPAPTTSQLTLTLTLTHCSVHNLNPYLSTAVVSEKRKLGKLKHRLPQVSECQVSNRQ